MIELLGRALAIKVIHATILIGQASPKAESYSVPRIFRVYSQDGRESHTAHCLPVKVSGTRPISAINCNFTTVRLNAPDQEASSESFGSMIRLVDQKLKDEKASPQELGKHQANVEALRQSLCQADLKSHEVPPSASKASIEFHDQFASLCKDANPRKVLNLLDETNKRTCTLWVYKFELDFKKVKDGQWLYKQDEPGLTSQAIKIYELTGEGFSWTLSETRVPLKGSTDKLQRTTWSPKMMHASDVPCDFISHQMVQAQ